MEERNLRKTRVGKVVSDKMDKTIVVAVVDSVKHPLYKKVVKKLNTRPSGCSIVYCIIVPTRIFSIVHNLATCI